MTTQIRIRPVALPASRVMVEACGERYVLMSVPARPRSVCAKTKSANWAGRDFAVAPFEAAQSAFCAPVRVSLSQMLYAYDPLSPQSAG